MIHLKNKFEIEKMYRAGQIVKETLFLIEEYVKPGITTLELDKIAENFIIKNKAIPGFKGLYGFPGTLCVSIDDEVVHGIPSNRVLKEGEIIGIDVGSIYDDFYGDHAKTFPVGKIYKLMKKYKKINKGNYMDLTTRKERSDMILEPLQVMVQLALLSQSPIGTKVSVSDNILQLHPPSFFQGAWRWYNSDGKDDLYYLFHRTRKNHHIQQ